MPAGSRCRARRVSPSASSRPGRPRRSAMRRPRRAGAPRGRRSRPSGSPAARRRRATRPRRRVTSRACRPARAPRPRRSDRRSGHPRRASTRRYDRGRAGRSADRAPWIERPPVVAEADRDRARQGRHADEAHALAVGRAGGRIRPLLVLPSPRRPSPGSAAGRPAPRPEHDRGARLLGIAFARDPQHADDLARQRIDLGHTVDAPPHGKRLLRTLRGEPRKHEDGEEADHADGEDEAEGGAATESSPAADCRTDLARRAATR